MEKIIGVTLCLLVVGFMYWVSTWPEEGNDIPHWYDDPDYPGNQDDEYPK